ncbi:MAG: hypothetical protein GXX93_05140 [Anaerolineae bacterium]|nr:hypothetical protein [Anaerolineae bacterium]
MLEARRILVLLVALLAALAGVVSVSAWTPVDVATDPNLRMPGTQPNGALTFQSATGCNCHFDYYYMSPPEEPGLNWEGSVMSQSARDPIFFASLVVAAQDSIWALGNPNAADMCVRCHFPMGWLRGNSSANAINFSGYDYEGVSCDLCHRLYDPHFEFTFAGTREGTSPEGVYWDEATTASHTALTNTLVQDRAASAAVQMFNNSPFFDAAYMPPDTYTEATSGQMYVAAAGNYRGPFADAGGPHPPGYSRFHKSRYFCGTCHDISNGALANQGADPTQPLPTEVQPAYAYYHAERTFSEFMLSDYGQEGGAAGTGSFAPSVFETSRPGNVIASCQDCHMRDVSGAASGAASAVMRPSGSTEHPNSGQPLHDLTGGGHWVATVLASTVPTSLSYDPTNAALLGNPGTLTLDLTQGAPLDWTSLQAGAGRSIQTLSRAASIEAATYLNNLGTLSFRIQNHTGHKLLTGYPEGRRMFVNVKVFDGADLVYEVNPYDAAVGMLKGQPGVAGSPSLGPNERYDDRLVFEAKGSSTLTGEQQTFHFTLTTGRYKDNRIPPRGFDVAASAERLADPVYQGLSAPTYFTAAEYAGGYDHILLSGLPLGATKVEVGLHYQTSTREYIEFLRDEINGTGGTLVGTGAGGDPPYIVQTDGLFSHLRGWGNAIWSLWEHNKDVPGMAPIQITSADAAVEQSPMTYLPLVTRR